jgi:hypothetical protein
MTTICDTKISIFTDSDEQVKQEMIDKIIDAQKIKLSKLAIQKLCKLQDKIPKKLNSNKYSLQYYNILTKQFDDIKEFSSYIEILEYLNDAGIKCSIFHLKNYNKNYLCKFIKIISPEKSSEVCISQLCIS